MAGERKPWAANGPQGKEFKGSFTDLPDNAVCRGDLRLGTGCGKCSRCRQDWPDAYRPKVTVHEMLDGGKLKHRWGPFDSAPKAEMATRTARRIETSQGKVFALVTRTTTLL